MCVSMHVSLCGCVHIWMLLRPIHYIFMPFLVLALPHYNQTYVNTHSGGFACMYTCVFIHTTCINIPTTNINTIWECRRRRRCRRYRFSCCRSSESNFYSYYMYGSNINNTHSHTHTVHSHTQCAHMGTLCLLIIAARLLCAHVYLYISSNTNAQNVAHMQSVSGYIQQQQQQQQHWQHTQCATQVYTRRRRRHGSRCMCVRLYILMYACMYICTYSLRLIVSTSVATWYGNTLSTTLERCRYVSSSVWMYHMYTCVITAIRRSVIDVLHGFFGRLVYCWMCGLRDDIHIRKYVWRHVWVHTFCMSKLYNWNCD